MEWETPSFVVIRMDAELSAYQGDFDPAGDDPVAESPTPSLTPLNDRE